MEELWSPDRRNSRDARLRQSKSMVKLGKNAVADGRDLPSPRQKGLVNPRAETVMEVGTVKSDASRASDWSMYCVKKCSQGSCIVKGGERSPK